MANEKNWATGVNQRILRDGAGWDSPSNIIEDATRSGKRKRRLYATQKKRVYQIKMIFTHDEYVTFDNWFNNELLYGLYSFNFPCIDKKINGTKVYRFTPDGAPKYTNPSGNKVGCSMVWEEM